jgi:hypothetical protein
LACTYAFFHLKNHSLLKDTQILSNLVISAICFLKNKTPKLGAIMTLDFKSTYIKAVQARYFKSTKKEKSVILDELCSITGYERKWAIKILAKGHKTGKKASGRSRQYSEESITHPI